MNSSFTPLSDEELVEKILVKDREALGELFRRYHKSFFNLAYRFSGDYFLADDLTSEIFLRIYRYLKTFDRNKASFRTWGYKIATNTCLTFKIKSSKIKVKRSPDPSGLSEVEVEDEKVNLEKGLEKNEISGKVQKALRQLPEKYRLALYLYYFEDLKYKEVAESLNLPVNTVRTHIKRGKEMLKKQLADLIT